MGAELERLPIRPILSLASMTCHSRAIRPRLKLRSDEEEGDVDAPMSPEEQLEKLSTWIGELVVVQSEMRSMMERHFVCQDEGFDSLDQCVHQFQDRIVLAFRSSTSAFSALPSWPPVPPSE